MSSLVSRVAAAATVLLVASLPAAAQEVRDLDRALTGAVEAGELSGLHAAFVAHDGEVLAEAYFSGEDQRWGEPIGMRTFGPDELHDLRSVTKSVVGLLYGIALSEGKVPPVDAPLIAQFPEYADLLDDPQRASIRIEDALSMTMGTEWNEDLPYSDPRNSEVAMEMADDRYRFVLDRPMVSKPGEAWTYSGGATAIVGKLISDGVGEPIDTYAERVLFAPLGISSFEWVRGDDGIPSAASGLRLTLPDLAKIGEMILQEGRYDGRQIVPAEWLKASMTPHAEVPSGLRYGYFWWLAPYGNPPAWAAGFGNGGQRLTVQPDMGVVVAVLAGNYNQPGDWQLPVKIIEEYVVPAVQARGKP